MQKANYSIAAFVAAGVFSFGGTAIAAEDKETMLLANAESTDTKESVKKAERTRKISRLSAEEKEEIMGELIDTMIEKGMLTEKGIQTIEGRYKERKENLAYERQAARESELDKEMERPRPEPKSVENLLAEIDKRGKMRGYIQIRNTAMLGGDKAVNLWSDRSVGNHDSLGGGADNFLIRRARLIFFGDVGDHLSYYLQPDFASSAGDTGNVVQLRDAYADLYLDKARVHRFRVGQSKVPYGFENLQSSQNRLSLDRNDALNSAVRDERDLGIFYYYTPLATQKLFQEIQKAGLKHTGNYGQLGAGIYNGQGANRRDSNGNYHVVARATYPWKTASGQYYEVGVQGYTGRYTPSTGTYRDEVVGAVSGCGPSGVSASLLAQGIRSCTPMIDAVDGNNSVTDRRGALSFMMYPQPFGLQAEWNWGTTPGLNMATNTIAAQSLNGGYVQAMYMKKDWNGWGTFIPFIKWQYFNGYNKAERNAPQNRVNDWELGLEWQIKPEVEIAAVYHRMNRNNLVTGAGNGTEAKQDYAPFKANAMRMQLQVNF